MDIYLTNLKTNSRLRFPMLPETISVKLANQFASYDVLSLGELRTPDGTALDAINWSGMLPGAKRKGAPYIREWQDPKAVYQWLEKLKAQDGKPVKAQLLITETPVNCDVYLSSFTATPSGGYGDISYSISLIQAKEIKVRQIGQEAAPAKSSAPARPSPPAAETHTVASGDTLWKIAQKYYGNGTLYTRIYNANKGIIGSDPRLIRVGQVLTIPSIGNPAAETAKTTAVQPAASASAKKTPAKPDSSAAPAPSPAKASIVLRVNRTGRADVSWVCVQEDGKRQSGSFTSNMTVTAAVGARLTLHWTVKKGYHFDHVNVNHLRANAVNGSFCTATLGKDTSMNLYIQPDNK